MCEWKFKHREPLWESELRKPEWHESSPGGGVWESRGVCSEASNTSTENEWGKRESQKRTGPLFLSVCILKGWCLLFLSMEVMIRFFSALHYCVVCWFSYVKPSLGSWVKSQLVIVLILSLCWTEFMNVLLKNFASLFLKAVGLQLLWCPYLTFIG